MMQKWWITRAAMVILTALLLPPSAAAQTDPATLFGQFIDARNRGDVAGALAIFTDDMIYRGGACTPCVGAAEMRSELERRVAQGQQTAISRADVRTDVAGEVAVLLIEFTTEEQRSAGRAPSRAVASIWARDDRISFVSIVTAPAVAAVMSP